MQNIDPVYFLTPAITVAFSFGLAVYWRLRRRFSGWVLLTSLVAYAGAIALKVVLQALTYAPFAAAVGGNPAALGVYFGAQTAVFEVGGAFAVARYAVSRQKLNAGDAEGYGIGLAMWENGVLIGALGLVNYVAYYAILGSGGSLATQLYNTLVADAPALFNPPSAALPVVGLAVLERVSSLLGHFSWGYLVVLAAVFRRRSLFLLALPMGFGIDFLAPFAGAMGPALFEAAVFALSAASLAVALLATKGVRGETTRASRPGAEGSPQTLARTTVLRSMSFGKVYIGLGVLLPLLTDLPLGAASSSAGAQVPALIGELPALMVPMAVIVGCMGGLMVFASDRSKGVFEYLIAYGVDTSAIFWSVLEATLALASLILALDLLESVLVLAALGTGVGAGFIELAVFYTIPLSLAAPVFMNAAGMVWSSLTKQMVGVNTPVGLAPLLGLAPVMVVLTLAGVVGTGGFVLLTGGTTVGLLAAAGLMVYVATRKMSRERFLSNA
ncbi:MAG: YhfC family intramembrane metalloprotease [Nitrososphaerota archaeon]|nr:YhfC family intramembrane metalloprotease [Nitrososphaerota archaeon]